MTGVASAVDLFEQGLFRDAATLIDGSKSTVSRELRVLRARLEVDVGSLQKARETADALLKEDLSHAERAHCWEIVARVELNSGGIDRGLMSMRRASQAAMQSQDPRTQARLIATNCDALLHWVGIEPSATEVPRLRRAAIATGDPFCLVAFHSLVSELEAKKGLLSNAKHSAEIARGLLEKWPNVWQQGRLAVARAGIHIIESDYDSALSATQEALQCADRSGSRRVRIPALGNLAHIKLVQGDLTAAREAVLQFFSAAQKGGNTEIAALDTQLQIALASGDLPLAEVLAGQVQAISSSLDAGTSFHGLWSVLTRVKWLYRSGDFKSGVALAEEAIPQVERLADRSLLTRMKLVAAEGLGRTSRALDGARLVAEAMDSSNDTPLEIVAESMRVIGGITAESDRHCAEQYFERAARIFDAVGNLTSRDEVLREAKETLGVMVSVVDVTPGEGLGDDALIRKAVPDSRPAAATLTERIAALLQLAPVPPLLAKEFLSLLSETGAVLRATVVKTTEGRPNESLASYSASATNPMAEDPQHLVRIPLGRHRDSSLEIVAVPTSNPAARATVLSIDKLVQAAMVSFRAQQLKREQASLWPKQSPEQQLGLIYTSDRMRELVNNVRRVATSNITVLLTGETGVGKELFARALHQASARSDRTFLPFNCSTVPRDMFDSQLFGHRRGSFTGALEDSPGVIRAAAGGTLFLDEIGEMSLDAQPKLLRFLESGEIMALGEQKPRQVDVRVVAATNANLDQLVREGRFREDLFYRLDVIRIEIPPLRERREEIPSLVEHFLERFGREQQKPLLRIADETLEYLVLYKWPGNVRQLANEIRRIVALAEPGSVVMPAHLSDGIAASRRTIPVDAPPRQSTEVVTRIDQPLAAAVEHIERATIQRAIAIAEGHLDEAAKILGLSRKGLYLKRQRLKIE